MLPARIFILSAIFFLGLAKAAVYNGRLTLGAFLSQERYEENDGTESSNDTNQYYGQFFLKVKEFSKQKFSVTMDIRDKYDLFHKINYKDLSLEAQNKFQIRELSTDWTSQNEKFTLTAGRFKMFSNIMYVDGAQFTRKISNELSLAFSAGFNPMTFGKYELDFKVDQKVVAASFKIQKNQLTKNINLLSQNSIIKTKTDDTPDPPACPDELFFHSSNTIKFYKNIISLVTYYNVEPVRKFKHIWISAYRQFFKTIDLKLFHTNIDYKNSYNNNAILKEDLGSRVFSTGLITNYRVQQTKRIGLRFDRGKRDVDNKSKYLTKIYFNDRIFRNFVSYNIFAGTRKRYTYDDEFYGGEIGYYSKKFEIHLNHERSHRKEESGTEYITAQSDLALSHFWSKKLFSSLVIQSDNGNKTSTTGIILRVGYRFGNMETTPIRAGAPHRGRI